jgi:electron transport complex protein RnfE
MNFFKAVKNGIVTENPTFRLVLGTCPTLAVTTLAVNGIGMGLSTMGVLIFSNLFISMMRNVIPDKIRIPCYVVVIAAFVSIVEMLLKAFAPAVNAALGVYIPLIVVNCIILGRAESFANKNTPVLAVADGIGMGLGFTLALTLIGCVRELIGNGSLFGMAILGSSYKPMLVAILPPGAFIVYGSCIGILNFAQEKKRNKEAAKSIPNFSVEEKRAA